MLVKELRIKHFYEHEKIYLKWKSKKEHFKHSMFISMWTQMDYIIYHIYVYKYICIYYMYICTCINSNCPRRGQPEEYIL